MKYVIRKRCAQKITTFYRNVSKKYKHSRLSRAPDESHTPGTVPFVRWGASPCSAFTMSIGISIYMFSPVLVRWRRQPTWQIKAHSTPV